jgi:hypothetical protein
MKKQILQELNDIKYLLNYNRGKIISEQEQFEAEDIDFEEIDIDDEDDDEDINYLKGEFNEEYDDDEEYDYMVDPNAEEMLPSFDSSSFSGKYLGMAKPMGDMDTRTPKASDDFYPRTPKERERDMRDIDMEIDEEMDLPVMLPGTKEKERTKVTPGTKPKTTPKTPYNPKPGPKPDPKAGRKGKGHIPNWLTFNKLGINLK